MKKFTLDLQQIGASGGGMIISARGRTTIELRKIAASAKGLVIIKDAEILPTDECRQIAASGSDRVIFDFTK